MVWMREVTGGKKELEDESQVSGLTGSQEDGNAIL